jgi:hypothetical protein
MSVKVMSWVWDHSPAKHGERLVLLAIADNASDDGTRAWPSVAEIQRKTQLKESSVRASIASLSDKGQLIVEDQAGPRGCNRYTVVMDPSRFQTPPESGPLQKDAADPSRFMAQTPPESGPVTVLEPSLNHPLAQKPANKPSRRSPETPPPDIFPVTPSMRSWAVANGITVDLDRETDIWLDHHRSHENRFRNWTAAWKKWMRKTLTWPAARQPAAAGYGYRGLHEQ